MDKPNLYVVVWDDAHGNQEMFDATTMEHKPYRFTAVGFLVRSDEIGISLAREIGDDGRFRDHEFVPRVLVVEEYMLPLKYPRQKKVKSSPP